MKHWEDQTFSNPSFHPRNRKDYNEAMASRPEVCFDESRPQENFCTAMTCAGAGESSPTVQGASYLVALPFNDPEAFDDTGLTSAGYGERCRQFSREALFLFFRSKT